MPFLFKKMKVPAKFALLLTTILLFYVSGTAQEKKILPKQAVATKTRIAKNGAAYAGTLYATIGGKEKLISDIACMAWLVENGKSIIYSKLDGAGGYENEGQSLRIYNVATGKTRKIMAAYFLIDKVSDVRLSNKKTALLVEMSDGGLGASHFAVVDPTRGEVFFRNDAILSKWISDRIFLNFYNEANWEKLTGDRKADEKVRPTKKEQHDLKRLLQNPVIRRKPTNI